ncbi:hypothetical protein JTE90_020618 [Oedothorax gibbosus]|uniref:Uncharacterized protein n=1 Tax=Oedothorax gibbosus TaxID=931172 RepID=A0AAV6TTJ0_9ARAC|nr:hypothetical protein JTE90_020618 [Oedothorax gibbosus]
MVRSALLCSWVFAAVFMSLRASLISASLEVEETEGTVHALGTGASLTATPEKQAAMRAFVDQRNKFLAEEKRLAAEVEQARKVAEEEARLAWVGYEAQRELDECTIQFQLAETRAEETAREKAAEEKRRTLMDAYLIQEACVHTARRTLRDLQQRNVTTTATTTLAC